jgi:hypothetical protein
LDIFGGDEGPGGEKGDDFVEFVGGKCRVVFDVGVQEDEDDFHPFVDDWIFEDAGQFYELFEVVIEVQFIVGEVYSVLFE